MTIMTDKKKTILEAVEKLTDTYRKEELFLGKDRERLPNKKEIINFIKDMRSIIFPDISVWIPVRVCSRSIMWHTA